jgi:PAS domain S-box-containing protein
MTNNSNIAGEENGKQKIDSLRFENSLMSNAYFQLKETGSKLKESEEKFAKIFKTSPFAIIITRAKDGKIMDVNDAFTRIAGYSREEALANSTIGLNLWLNIADRDMVLASLKEGSEVQNKEFQFKKKSGELLTGLFSAQIIHIATEAYVLSSISDITESKQKTEELEQMNKFMIGRELKMVELKEEIEKLKEELAKQKSNG